jgi:hypothetical protein
MSFTVLMSLYIKSDKLQFINCLTSISKQSYLPNEIILIIDGPIYFNLDEIFLQFPNLIITTFYNKFNIGLAKSLNIGLGLSNNEIIFRMDTDDICLKNRFEIQYNFMLNNPNITLCGCHAELIDINSKLLKIVKKVPLFHKEIIKQLSYKNPFIHPTVCFRKTQILNAGGYDNISLYEDWFLWFKLSKLNNIIFHNLDNVLLQYRIRSFSERKGLQIIKFELNFLLTLYKKNYINLFTLVINLFLKTIIRIMPTKIYIMIKIFFENKSI